MSATLDIERGYWERGMGLVVGIDEAGRGPLAGPVVAAAVVFPPNVTIPGVKDSKKLSEPERERLFGLISTSALSVQVGVVAHDTIDRVNILQATMLAMRQAVDGLTVTPDVLLVDGPTFHEDRYPFQTIIDGDDLSFTIAAASIVAKVTRDRLMRHYHTTFPVYGFAKHKGYGTPEHMEAIKQYGLCEIHRRSFTRRFTDG